MRTVTLTAGFLLAFASTSAHAQLQSRPVPARAVESFTFQSPSMGVRFSLNVGLPQGYKAGDGKKYPALIVTDGDFVFGNVYESASTLSSVITPLFIISVGTSLDEGEAEHTRRRIYEFSPPGWDRQDKFGQAVEGYCKQFKSPEDRCTGGSGKFLTAIATEMIPLLAAKFPIDTTQLGLFGLSAGGFFASWAIFQPNTPFTKYIISSPAMARSFDRKRPMRRLTRISRSVSISRRACSRPEIRCSRGSERSSAGCRIWPACLPAGSTRASR